jgi:hypothetical protein
MAKKEKQEGTTWAGKMKEFGGGNFTFLSSDGEAITFIVVGLPRLLKSVYQKKEQERIGCPVVTDEGFQLFICGKRCARKITKHEAVFKTSALMVIRHGIEGDTNAKYEVRVVPEPETFKRLSDIAAEDFTPERIDEAVAEASKVMAG